jgi:cytochrome c biogenesis protein CcdA
VITLTTLGALAAILGNMLNNTGDWWYILLSVIMFIFGLEMLGIINIIPKYCKVPNGSKGIIGAFF